jgi:hypothetical protein
MCPFCIATTVMIASSIAGTGGLAAITSAILRKKTAQTTQSEEKEVQDGNNGDGGRTWSNAA